MKNIPKEQVLRHIQTENPWWGDKQQIGDNYHKTKHRAYFNLFLPLVKELSVRRATLLMGPRRVGKTFLIHHAIQALIQEGVPAKQICYLSVDRPLYNGCGLEDLLEFYSDASGADVIKQQCYVFLDEIQYLKDWEVHLKVLVDSRPSVKFVASGSSAAALRLKSHESGAGRFTDFLLPPLTFHEYLDLLGKTRLVSQDQKGEWAQVPDIGQLNGEFINYLNFGGYPEVIFSEIIRADPARFVKSDIIDKVLLRDLPSLYGIQDIQELNTLFTTLAYNSAGEVSLEELSQNSGVAKNTIKRYIEYLEAAFLIKIIHRIDHSSKRFMRANYFKVYLTNPSIRSALFSPIEESDQVMGSMAETGVLSQWFHSTDPLHYARWQKGEVDMVCLGHDQKPIWAVEVKWTDRMIAQPAELRSVVQFCKTNGLERVLVTSRTKQADFLIDSVRVEFVPTSLYCYTVGYNLIRNKGKPREPIN